ncbi:hypothetical protein [uncultured Sphingomonas sp.]|uniref:hypothetical protein n=1 Tax=uncultured Sphingomonas sp. TaxID=158754 RepID=UPI0025FEB557|nr:hypothetical protein [uncultured Sphingomonas sp.]
MHRRTRSSRALVNAAWASACDIDHRCGADGPDHLGDLIAGARQREDGEAVRHWQHVAFLLGQMYAAGEQ